MSAWTIRVATLADAGPLSALVQMLIAEWLVPDGDAVATARLQREHSAEAIANRICDGWPHWLAESTAAAGNRGELLGYIALRPPTHVFNCYVRADQHQRGIGTALWQTLLEQVSDRVNANAGSKDKLKNELKNELKLDRDEPGETTITVNASLRSVVFYQRLGFVAVTPAQCFEGLHFQPMRFVLSGGAGVALRDL